MNKDQKSLENLYESYVFQKRPPDNFTVKYTWSASWSDNDPQNDIDGGGEEEVGFYLEVSNPMTEDEMYAAFDEARSAVIEEVSSKSGSSYDGEDGYSAKDRARDRLREESSYGAVIDQIIGPGGVDVPFPEDADPEISQDRYGRWR